LKAKVAKRSDFNGPSAVIKNFGRVSVGLYRHNGKYYAYLNHCPHQGGPACEGKLMNVVECKMSSKGREIDESVSADLMSIVCPWHGYGYDLETGICRSDKRLKLTRFEITEEDDDIILSTSNRI
jgi:nitrite reductase/ring-hydroxylating ferredoxin subunit